MFSKLIRFHLMLIYHHRWKHSSWGQRTVQNPHDLPSFLINHLPSTGHFSSNALNWPEWSIGLNSSNQFGFSSVISTVMAIGKVKEHCTNWCWSRFGYGVILFIYFFHIIYLFLIQFSHRVEFKKFPCKIGLPRNASWSINVKYGLF